jgi:hypothetical protein
MAYIVQADERGALVVPAGVAQVQPGARFTVEPCGDGLLLRRQFSDAEDWWGTTTPAQRVTWLEEWISSLPASPALPREAAHRDSMYD